MTKQDKTQAKSLIAEVGQICLCFFAGQFAAVGRCSALKYLLLGFPLSFHVPWSPLFPRWELWQLVKKKTQTESSSLSENTENTEDHVTAAKTTVSHL